MLSFDSWAWSQPPDREGLSIDEPRLRGPDPEKPTEGNQEPQRPLPPLTAPAGQEETQSAQRQRGEAERQRQDVVAQQRIATAAEEQARYIGDQNELIRVGNWLLIGTILATAVAAVSAALAARAAGKSTGIAAEAFRLDSAPYLVLKPVDAEKIRFESNPHALPDGLACYIENSGRGPALVTAIFRKWELTAPDQDPVPVRGVNADGIWERKSIELPIGPGGRSPHLNAVSATIRTNIEPGEWAYFLGYIEYRDTIRGNEYVSGFCYVIRPNQPNLGLHVAFVSKDRDKYWYHDEIS